VNPQAYQNITSYVEVGLITGLYQWLTCTWKSMNSLHLISRRPKSIGPFPYFRTVIQWDLIQFYYDSSQRVRKRQHKVNSSSLS
jgi:hypothetical protein